jgi:hypothetical protein
MSFNFCQECGIAHPGMTCPRSPQKIEEMRKTKEKLDREAEARRVAGGK